MGQRLPGHRIDPDQPLTRRRSLRLSAPMDARIEELAAEWGYDAGETMRIMLDLGDLLIRMSGVQGPHWLGVSDVVADTEAPHARSA